MRALSAVACLFLVMTSTACAIGYGAGPYGIRGVEIVRTPPPADVVNALSAEEVEISGRPVFRVEDDLAIFEWTVGPTYVNVRITNKSSRQNPSSESLVVLLDSAEFVDPGGETRDLVLVSWMKKHPSNVIRPGQRRVYRFFPAGYYDERRALFGGPSPSFTAENPEDIEKLYSEHVGNNFRLGLLIQVEKITYEYEFAMTVSEIHPYVVRVCF